MQCLASMTGLINEYAAVGEMRFRRENRRARTEPALLTLCPPQIPHDLTYLPLWEAQELNRLSYRRDLMCLCTA
jgi:hypothetical protein